MHKIDRGAGVFEIGQILEISLMRVLKSASLMTISTLIHAVEDIQAVIAADYIRNLREEVKKGIQGRLNQGLYRFRAPTGYRDRGGGRVKTPDPVYAPLLVEAFRR